MVYNVIPHSPEGLCCKTIVIIIHLISVARNGAFRDRRKAVELHSLFLSIYVKKKAPLKTSEFFHAVSFPNNSVKRKLHLFLCVKKIYECIISRYT